MNTAENINIIGAFCGVRDVEELTEEALYRKYNIHQADVMALFGGTILCGGDVMAEAMRENVAKTCVKSGWMFLIMKHLIIIGMSIKSLNIKRLQLINLNRIRLI